MKDALYKDSELIMILRAQVTNLVLRVTAAEKEVNYIRWLSDNYLNDQSLGGQVREHFFTVRMRNEI